MAPFEAKWTKEQREAVVHAALEREIRPYRRISQLAAAGELTLDGAALPAFEVPEGTVADMARKARKARAGTLKSGLTDVPAADAVETLRQRLVSATDYELARLERRMKRPGAKPVTGEELRQIARCVRELAALPAKGDPRPVPPGQRKPEDGEHNGGRTTSGLAGAILAASRPATRPIPHTHIGDGPEPRPDNALSAEDGAAQYHGDGGDNGGEGAETEDERAPGAWMRERVGDLSTSG